jgi:hypothetical protein
MGLYTDTAKVANAARNIAIGTGKAETLSSTKAEEFIVWAESEINSKLSPVVFTPLNLITRSGVQKYPDPIEHIATQLAAGFMVESVFARIEPQASESGKVHKENAQTLLKEICDGILQGSRRLDGQRHKARNFFANPQVAPLEPPRG